MALLISLLFITNSIEYATYFAVNYSKGIKTLDEIFFRQGITMLLTVMLWTVFYSMNKKK